ncbi:hypothetical protein HDV06_000304 [Boothiomyces sp. JEL0866]|nr:hypothetical protein HDV06_000304 [Boothiomyces sp. JEL0866]
MTSDFNQVIKRRWKFDLPELPISRPTTRQLPKTPKSKNLYNEYTLNVHDYSRPVTHHQVRTPKKPTTAKREVFKVGGVNVVDYQFLIPKRFESGDYKVCLGFNVKNQSTKAGYYQDGYIIPWKTPEITEKPKFKYLKKKETRPLKTPAIELEPPQVQNKKVEHHVAFDLPEEQFRGEDTFLPLLDVPKPQPRAKLQRQISTPRFDDIIVDKTIARQKAKEMAEKQKQLISNALKHYTEVQKEKNPFIDMNLMAQIKDKLRDALMNEHCSPKSRKLIFKSILEGNDLENIMNIAPEMARPINEYDELIDRDSVIMYKLPTPHHAEEAFIPETYKKLSSTIKVQHKTLVPTRKAIKKEEVKLSEEQENMSRFFKDFQTLLDRQNKLEGEAVAMMGNIQTHLETREIARYPLDDLLKLIWNQFSHLKDSYEDILPTEIVQLFYLRMRKVLLISDDFTNDDSQHAEYIKEQIKTLNHRCFIYLKAFTGHMKRTIGVCSESISGGPQRLCLGLAKLFGNLIFRTEMPVTNDVYIPPSLAIRQINFSDEDIGISVQKEYEKHLKKDGFWDDEVDVKLPEKANVPVQSKTPVEQVIEAATVIPQDNNGDQSSTDRPNSAPNGNSILEPSDDPLLREILEQNGINLGNLSKSEKALFNPSEAQGEQEVVTEQKSETDIFQYHHAHTDFSLKSKDVIEKHKMELETFGWDTLDKNAIALTVFHEETCLNAFERALHIILLNWDLIFNTEKAEEARPSFGGGALVRKSSHRKKSAKGAHRVNFVDNPDEKQPNIIQIDQMIVNGKEMAVDATAHPVRPRSTRTNHNPRENSIGEAPNLPQLVNQNNSFQRPKSSKLAQQLEPVNQPYLVISDSLPAINNTLSDSFRPTLSRSVSRRNSRVDEKHRHSNGHLI